MQTGKMIVLATAFGVLSVGLGLGAYYVAPSQTYYQLRDDVAGNRRLTPDMVEPVKVSRYGAPQHTLSMGDIQSRTLQTRVSLRRGDIVSTATVGDYQDISVGAPDDYGIVSFTIGADRAAAGMIERGFFFDLWVTTEVGTQAVFSNMMALRATDTEVADGQVVSAAKQYMVALKPEHLGRFVNLIERHPSAIMMTISPTQNEYNLPELDKYTGLFRVEEEQALTTITGPDGTRIDIPAPINAGVGMDYTFTPLKRDEFNRPVEILDVCGEGNKKVSDPKVCASYTATVDDVHTPDGKPVNPDETIATDPASPDPQPTPVVTEPVAPEPAADPVSPATEPPAA